MVYEGSLDQLRAECPIDGREQLASDAAGRFFQAWAARGRGQRRMEQCVGAAELGGACRTGDKVLRSAESGEVVIAAQARRAYRDFALDRGAEGEDVLEFRDAVPHGLEPDLGGTVELLHEGTAGCATSGLHIAFVLQDPKRVLECGPRHTEFSGEVALRR